MNLYQMRKFVAPEFIFGVGSRHKVGYCARNLMAQKVLIVSDAGVIAAAWVKDVQQDLEAVGIESVVFHDLTPNPKDYEVMAGAAFYAKEHCDVIVAVGGGSVMDCAKAIGIVHVNGGSLLDFEGVDNIALPSPPLICIPTTAGTAADISQFCIVVNSQERYKMAIISKTVLPDIALIDPETTTTMDAYLTACTGLDALTHAIEAYVSTANSPMTDVHALEAINLIWQNLEQAVIQPMAMPARENMLLGSLHAGLAFSNASLGAVHAMAHSVGGYLDLPHGECNALLLEHVIRFNITSATDRFKQIAQAMGIEVSGMSEKERTKRITDEINKLRQRIGVSSSLAARGVRGSDIPELAGHAVKDACIFTNPRHANVGDIKAIYDEAL